MNEITIKDIIRHIKTCNRYHKRYNWLGFVESRNLTSEVESLFSVGVGCWDWVSGNDKLKQLETTHTMKG